MTSDDVRWRHLHVTMLQCLAKFSNGLVHWSTKTIRAKDYETVSKFVKVMPRILWPLFSPTRCITDSYDHCHSKITRSSAVAVIADMQQYDQPKQESWAIAKMTARCALCMGSLKIFGSPWLRPWLRPWLLFPKFLMGFCFDWAYKCACKIWSS